MSVAITILILAPVAAFTIVGITLDERYGITDRIARTRPARRIRTFIDRHIDGGQS